MTLLVVMGSGETAPTMLKLHREVLGATTATGPAVLLDTTFGFQLNADDLVAKTLGYFAESVGTAIEVVPWRRADAPTAERERALALLSRASWAFAGPGSPSYALHQWRGTEVPGALLDVATRGGTLVFGSAAACTLGTHTIPVYEIYKVGAEPTWLPGLDLFGQLTGIEAAIVPHYDNTEGGTTYDTRFCYLGEPRLALLEAALPDQVGVLGVDEHTALVIDLTTRTAQVAGNGTVTVRRRGRSRVFASGQEIPLDHLAALLRGEASEAFPSLAWPPVDVTPGSDRPDDAPARSADDARSAPPSLGAEALALQGRFEDCLNARDVDGCVTAVLELEAAIVAWSADTLQSDDTARARRVLRGLIVRLGDLAEVGAKDPRDALAPLVQLALDLRARARSAQDYATSDLVRDRLTAAGVEVRDTPDGAHWTLREP